MEAITEKSMVEEDPQSKLFSVLKAIADVPENEWLKLSSVLRPMTIRKDNFFLRAGETPKYLGFNVSGLFRYYYVDFKGVEFTKFFVCDNDFVAPYVVLLSDQKSKVFIQAMEDSFLLIVDYLDYRKLLESHPCWQVITRILVERTLVDKEKREAELLMEDAKTRYLNFLEEFPELASRLKQYVIASYLGISPVTLSRIRTQLRRGREE